MEIEWTQWRIDELKAAIDEMVQASMDRTFAQMVDDYSMSPEINLKPGEVILFGSEGQIDAVFRVPEPLPSVLRRPIPPRNSYLAPDEAVHPTLRTASYQRIGERTYQRDE